MTEWRVTGDLWRLAVTVPDERTADAAVALLESAATAITAFEVTPDGDWLVQGFTEGKPDHAALSAGLALAAMALGIAEPALEMEPLDDIDWLKRNQESFPPMRIGRYFVHGSHIVGPPPGGSIPLRIDAATAFGTASMRRRMAACWRSTGWSVAAGGIASSIWGRGPASSRSPAAKSWRVPVRACDIDPHSVEVAQENVDVNRVGSLVECFVSDGYAAREVAAGAPYDLIFANILARPLARMAPDLARHLAPGGVAILSGLLANQESYVRAAHRAQGLRFAAGSRSITGTR